VCAHSKDEADEAKACAHSKDEADEAKACAHSKDEADEAGVCAHSKDEGQGEEGRAAVPEGAGGGAQGSVVADTPQQPAAASWSAAASSATWPAVSGPSAATRTGSTARSRARRRQLLSRCNR